VQRNPSPLVERYIREAAAWRPDVPADWVQRNPNLALGAEWNRPPDEAALARLHELGLDRVPLLAELYALHDGARLPSLGDRRLLPLAEAFSMAEGRFPPSPTPPGDAAVVFSDDNEFAVAVYTSGPLVGALFEYDVVFPEPIPMWRSPEEFIETLLASPDEEDWPDRMPPTLPTTGPGDAHRDDDWRIAQELYALSRDPSSRDDPLPLAMVMTPYERSDILLPYLQRDVEATEVVVTVLGGRRWEPARARLAEVAAWPRTGTRHDNAAFMAQRALAEWDKA
jgi:hypothetical protein